MKLIEVQQSGEPVVVDDVGDAHLLQLIRESETQDRIAARRKVRYATEWAQRHAVTDVLAAAHWSDADLRDVEETIGGEGTPLVASSCVDELARALGLSSPGAMQLMSDGLDLTHRLPEIHAGVEALRIAPWQARRIAKLTHALSLEAAAHVDERLAPVADSCGVVKIERLVAETIALFDPEAQQDAEDEAKADWDVQLVHYDGPVWGGTSRLEVVGDTPTLQRAYDALCADAATQPTDVPLGQRKVAALGRLLDGVGATSRTKLYLHYDRSEHETGIGTVERLGALTRATLTDWLGDTSRFTVLPVLDLARSDAVDQHDPPTWMRELVILRDRHCAHPGCDRPARDCDLDHLEPYIEMDDGGPPGQTRPDNLAPLCRRHHRAKTHHGWSYQREADGSYTWTSPMGTHLSDYPTLTTSMTNQSVAFGGMLSPLPLEP